ncbi:MAG: hypothetical protein IPQ01_08080 [Zoogloea sp.]|jgi:hypothetical protein|nr:hypothetical protein [Zoogloea sp.]
MPQPVTPPSIEPADEGAALHHQLGELEAEVVRLKLPLVPRPLPEPAKTADAPPVAGRPPRLGAIVPIINWLLCAGR